MGPHLTTRPAPVLFPPLTLLFDPSFARTSISSLPSACFIFFLTSSSSSLFFSFGGGLVVLNWLEELRSNFQGGLKSGLSVGMEVALVSSAILASSEVLDGFIARGMRLLLCCRVIFGFGSGILSRVSDIGRSLWRQMDDE